MNMYSEQMVEANTKFTIAIFVKANSLPADYQVIANWGGKSN
jgi:hypothetical protein